MLELPEVLNIKKQIADNIVGKKIIQVNPPTKIHKFCWYKGDAAEYDSLIKGAVIKHCDGFGIYVEMSFDNGYKLCFNDGVNARLILNEKEPRDYQLMIEFEDDSKLFFTVVMYGSIILHKDDYENEYYIKSKEAISPFSDGFKEYYYKIFSDAKQNCSAKAFLGTEQRFPGIGNGCLQDILYNAKIHPKRKISTFSEEDKEILYKSIVNTLKDMINEGGRDTEKDIFGRPGGYKVKLSKNTYKYPCLICGGKIVKEAYLGGSVYYCAMCQPLINK